MDRRRLSRGPQLPAVQNVDSRWYPECNERGIVISRLDGLAGGDKICMDGSFACPECGNNLELAGLAPGRQVRCGFCNRLLEVPFLPRVADPRWKRRRFARPRWFLWACSALAVAFVLIVGTGAFHFVTRQYDSAQQRAINQLLDSSRAKEADGDLGQALVDLDTAIEMARKAGPTYLARIDDSASKRPDLARREVQTLVDRLGSSDPTSFQLGHWLTLIARAKKDSDLSSLAEPIRQQFLADLDRQVAFELAAARRSAEGGQVLASFSSCERIAALFAHIGPNKIAAVRTETEALVLRLISQHGVTIETPKGQFAFGPKSYVNDMVPVVVKAFEAKGYLPYRPSSAWRAQWKHARYLATLVVSERLEGNYLSTANRLTRIEVRLTVTSSDQRTPIFQTTPTARSNVPNLPGYLSNRLAISGERSEELEKLLYDDARGRIDGSLAHSLQDIPECPGARTTNTP
jgi:hypothetical protein